MMGGVEMDFSGLGSGTLDGSVSTVTASTLAIDATTGNASVPAAVMTTTWSVKSAVNDSVAGYAANTLALCEICKGNTGAGPGELIIGGPNPALLPGTDQYTASNPGIRNSSHTPEILGSGDVYTAGNFNGANSTPTWVLSSGQILPTTTITAVRFYFGSAYDVSQEANATIEFTPEPGPIALVLGGLLLVAVGRWKRRAR
jgi:hypothetical protein